VVLEGRCRKGHGKDVIIALCGLYSEECSTPPSSSPPGVATLSMDERLAIST